MSSSWQIRMQLIVWHAVKNRLKILVIPTSRMENRETEGDFCTVFFFVWIQNSSWGKQKTFFMENYIHNNIVVTWHEFYLTCSLRHFQKVQFHNLFEECQLMENIFIFESSYSFATNLLTFYSLGPCRVVSQMTPMTARVHQRQNYGEAIKCRQLF